MTTQSVILSAAEGPAVVFHPHRHCYHRSMTQLDVLYRFGAQPTEAAILALAKVRDVYGVRKLDLREAEKTVRIEYDATRLTEPVIHQLLRRAGLDIVERVPLIVPPPPPPHVEAISTQ
jgi:hypothetical protein